MKRRIRLNGAPIESAEERARRLALMEVKGWAERMGAPTQWQREARWTGFVAGYLACLDDEVAAPRAADAKEER